jgi:hypothetical protein
VAFISSARVAPFAFSRRAITWALLLPGRERTALGWRIGAFLPRLGLGADLARVVAAGGFRVAVRALADSGSEMAVG